MSLAGGAAGKVAAVLVAGMVLATVGLGAAFSTGLVSVEPPAVESIDNQWGEVTDETTGIETRVVVNNPNGVGIPGVAGVTYDVAMNDVVVASGESGGLALSPGRNEITLRTDIDNRKIPAWWASHVNNGEETTVSIRTSLSAPLFSSALPARNRTFATDMLSSFNSDSGESVRAGGRTLLTVERTRASWGRATANETPLRFSGTVTNPTGEPLEFAEVGYAVSMNGIEVAEGTTGEPVEIGANATETIRVNSTLDNRKLDEWWVTHLENGERTTLDVQVFAEVETSVASETQREDGGTVDDDGTRRIPLSFMSKRVVFETDILGGGAATTRSVARDGGLDFAAPTVESVTRDWTTTDAGTRFSTTVVVDNPNPAGSALGDLALDARYRVSLNDVTLVEDGRRAALEPGRNELAFENAVENRTIKRWWISHVDRGQRTTLRTEADVAVDLGFAEFPVEVPNRTQTFETEMLSGFDGTAQTVDVRGRRIATFDEMDARFGNATMERTPMIVGGEVTNERLRPLTIERFGYRVEMNDVVLADNESYVGATVPGETTRSIETTGYLDNDKIPAWWVSHLENGERSELSVTYYAVVEYGGHEFTVDLEEMSYEDTVETDAFGEE